MPPYSTNNRAVSPSYTSSSSLKQHRRHQRTGGLSTNHGTIGTQFALQYDLQYQLGNGHSAKVHRCVEKSSGIPYAVKCFDRARMTTSYNRARPYHEASILVSLEHQNILGVKDCIEDDLNIYLVLELVPYCSLSNLLQSVERLSEDQTRTVFRQLCEALQYLHQREIVHRDIKLDNILLVDQHLNLKICDFGLAQTKSTNSASPGLYGTPAYMAPEVIVEEKHRQYTPASDVWSSGVVLYICLGGFPPFSDQLRSAKFPYTIRQQIALGHYSYPRPFWDDISTAALILIKQMLTVNVDRRSTIIQCLEHEWIRGGIRGSVSGRRSKSKLM